MLGTATLKVRHINSKLDNSQILKSATSIAILMIRRVAVYYTADLTPRNSNASDSTISKSFYYCYCY